MKRRDFLASMAASLIAPTWAHAKQLDHAAKLARMSIMTFDFSNILKIPGRPQKPIQTLDLLDLPDMFADRYGIHNIEFQHSHLPVDDPAYLEQLLARIKKAKSRITQINFEFASTISSPEPDQREQVVNLCRQWIDRAATYGCHRLMIYQGHLTPENINDAISTLKRISDYGKSKDVKVCMENRARAPKLRDNPNIQLAYPPEVLPPVPSWVVDDATKVAWLWGQPSVLSPEAAKAIPSDPIAWGPDGENTLFIKLLKATGTYANLDCGGMAVDKQSDMNTAMRTMMPFTSGQIHINWRSNPGWDLAETIRYIRDLGFKGLYVLEAHPQDDPYTFVKGLQEVMLANI